MVMAIVMGKAMRTVSKGILKARMLEYFRQVERTGEELVVTDKNKPVLKVVPLTNKKSPDEVFADVRPRFKSTERDVLESTAEYWDEIE
jgi:antitoxin (DNA-binding transcriptional repressor) of toxin-antitoxin stability system